MTLGLRAVTDGPASPAKQTPPLISRVAPPSRRMRAGQGCLAKGARFQIRPQAGHAPASCSLWGGGEQWKAAHESTMQN
ncbi:hypothetical protein S40285_09958 [Stachybotrys chlorohalonatus IBT 40285]|uniref:Uncharacterized protein n=1 Tax=Stachybotrys chlorohalonatus (strain IBT 40285) TaxID=1283841 RepID=A0A084QDP6_STAC4|nr:hypothetical protein S40285_09958 [Stachybotrys chlorohalonata IBT 40285]